MDLDPLELVAEPSGLDDDKPTPAQKAHARLNAAVAITVALLATFMGICKIKDDNICQAMQQAQANKVDHWSFYQARNVREEVAMATVAQLRVAALSKTGSEQAAYQEAIASFQRIADDQHKKK